MESRTVEPEEFAPDELRISDALRDAVEKEMEFLADRDLRLVRLRENDEGDVQQVTVQAGDEMYRLSEVSSGNVSRTVFRNPPRDEAFPYAEGDGEDMTAEEEPPEEAEDDGGEGDAEGVSDEDGS